jgi:hypothetical protein
MIVWTVSSPVFMTHTCTHDDDGRDNGARDNVEGRNSVLPLGGYPKNRSSIPDNIHFFFCTGDGGGELMPTSVVIGSHAHTPICIRKSTPEHGRVGVKDF